ncbi:hypothetical protein OKW49_001872 [Paraburkholderia youngii]
MHQLESGQQDPRTAKSLEPLHGPRASLDCPMVLLDHVVEMFGLADLDGNFTTFAYPLSLRDLEEMMAGRGVSVDHSTVHR